MAGFVLVGTAEVVIKRHIAHPTLVKKRGLALRPR